MCSDLALSLGLCRSSVAFGMPDQYESVALSDAQNPVTSCIEKPRLIRSLVVLRNVFIAGVCLWPIPGLSSPGRHTNTHRIKRPAILSRTFFGRAKRQAQVRNHPLDHLELLVVLLPEVGPVRLHNVEQLGAYRRYAAEVAGPDLAFPAGPNPRHLHQRLVAGRVHLLHGWREERIHG